VFRFIFFPFAFAAWTRFSEYTATRSVQKKLTGLCAANERKAVPKTEQRLGVDVLK